MNIIPAIKSELQSVKGAVVLDLFEATEDDFGLRSNMIVVKCSNSVIYRVLFKDRVLTVEEWGSYKLDLHALLSCQLDSGRIDLWNRIFYSEEDAEEDMGFIFALTII